MSDASAPRPARRRLGRKWLERMLRLDRLLSRSSELLNPILVKEARQALKSRHFVFTFSALLLAVWVWTVISVTMIQQNPGSPYNARNAFGGYFLILEVPLLVIVPFTAFRSLAGEREDGTYELVAITALNARQIILGKLGSALLQIMVYASVLAPCMLFTYMLRNIDILAIGWVLVTTLMLSLGLTSFALMLATLVRNVHFQNFVSVLVLGGLGIVATTWPAFVIDEVVGRRTPPLTDPMFILGTSYMWTMLALVSVLLLTAGAAALSFPSDNRSTKLRVAMMAMQLGHVGWMMAMLTESEFNDADGFAFAMFIPMAIFWAAMGAFMTGEEPELSPRVRRSLPESHLGRMAFTWFNPGSGTGYVFALSNLACIALTIVLMSVVSSLRVDVFGVTLVRFPLIPMEAHTLQCCLLITSYAVIYLGLGRLAIQGLRRVTRFGVIVAFLVQTLLMSVGIMGPLLLQTLLSWDRPWPGYTLLQAPNWAWTIAESINFRRGFLSGGTGVAVQVLIHASALVVFLSNVVLASRELRQLRVAPPDRVLEELRTGDSVAGPRSPFDD